MNMPNFLIIGAAKAGTTSLYHYLRQHPQIYMSPVKEPKFFALEGEALDYGGPGDNERMRRSSVTQLHNYQELFKGATSEKALGESSTLYMYSPKAAHTIKEFIPQVKLIAILRNPVERAFSHYLYMLRKNIEFLENFEEALSQEAKRIEANWMPGWHYKNRGYYFLQLKRYFELYDRNKIQVFLYEDFQNDVNTLLKRIFDFLEVDVTQIPKTNIRHNISGVPKNQALHNLLTKPHPLKVPFIRLFPSDLRRKINTSIRNSNLIKPELDHETLLRLTNDYSDDIVHLQDLIQRDLSDWMNV